MRIPSYVLTLALAFPAIAALPASAHPGVHARAAAPSEAVVHKLYTRWNNKTADASDDAVKAVAPLLTPAFARLLDRAYQAGDADGAIIEWDPFNASQESVDRHVVGKATHHQGYDLVPVSLWGEGQKRPHGVVLRVVPAGGTWRVDDVAVVDRKFPVPSLKKWLTDALAAAKKK